MLHWQLQWKHSLEVRHDPPVVGALLAMPWLDPDRQAVIQGTGSLAEGNTVSPEERLCEVGRVGSEAPVQGVMHHHKPRVSIGLPVFNGAKYLAEALDSILAQTYPDFELIISDNASTDGTEEICRAYAAKDGRIRYYRNEKNLGLARNFSRVFELSSGDYFKWAAHDDVIAPDFLMKCVEVLDQDSAVVLCHSKVTIIDEFVHEMHDFDITLDRIDSPKPHERFADLILTDRWCFEVSGLIRSSVLRMTPLMAGYIASDRILRAELGLRGRLHEIPESLFFSRDHPERSVRALPAHHLRAELFDPARAAKVVFPHWRILLEYFNCVRRVPLTRYERTRCYLSLVRWLGTDLNWARMAADLIIASVPNSWEFLRSLSQRYTGKKDG